MWSRGFVTIPTPGQTSSHINVGRLPNLRISHCHIRRARDHNYHHHSQRLQNQQCRLYSKIKKIEHIALMLCVSLSSACRFRSVARHGCFRGFLDNQNIKSSLDSFTRLEYFLFNIMFETSSWTLTLKSKFSKAPFICDRNYEIQHKKNFFGNLKITS